MNTKKILQLSFTTTFLYAFILFLQPMDAAKKAPDNTKTAPAKGENPLLTESSLPYHLPPFDKIKSESFSPAFAVALAEHLKEVDAIASSKEEPTFDNTIVALEKSGRTLDRVGKTFSNLTGANTDPVLQKTESEMAPKFAAHQDAINLNAALFKRIQTLNDRRDQLGLDRESAYLLERYYKDFVRAGAKLSEPDKKKLKAMNAEIASLETKFSQDVLNEKNADGAVVDNRTDLVGMSEGDIAAAASAAKADKKDGKFLIPLQNTTGQPALASLQNRPLRERLMKASLARNSHGGKFDTRETVTKIARLRAERATLLGYENHAAYQLEDETAKNVATVNKLLADLAPPAVANARKEAAAMQAVVDQEGGAFKIASWDWSLYSEKVFKAQYAFDESELKPYLELNHVQQDGVFYAANQIYGLTFKERKDLPVYQQDVRIFEVYEADGQPLALFLSDMYARPSKRGGAWMNEYVSQSDLFHDKPVVANHLNIPKPPAGEPTLLTFDEVTTMFHEFGHALHGMFSHVKYPRFAGTNVPPDFVEFPSQANEMWAAWPEVLKNYAKHYQTGAPLPQEMLDKTMSTRKFGQGFATTEYLAAALLDQAWHQLKPSEIPKDALAFEAEALKRVGADFEPVPPRYRSPYFSHSFSGGYSAGYYSYVWSEVLAADTTRWFKQNGGMKRDNGERFRQTLLSRGGSEDPLQQFKNFTGGEPDIAPLLEKRGLTGDSTPASAPQDIPPAKPKA